MPKRKDTGPTLCPLARTAEILGDRWALLILRELYFGNRHFEAIRVQIGATPQMLSARLRLLEAQGVIARRQSSPKRSDYRLTDKGKDLFPVLYAMRNWGERWGSEDEPATRPAVRYVHRACGHDVGLENACPHCGERLGYGSIRGALSAELEQERAARRGNQARA